MTNTIHAPFPPAGPDPTLPEGVPAAPADPSSEFGAYHYAVSTTRGKTSSLTFTYPRTGRTFLFPVQVYVYSFGAQRWLTCGAFPIQPEGGEVSLSGEYGNEFWVSSPIPLDIIQSA